MDVGALAEQDEAGEGESEERRMRRGIRWVLSRHCERSGRSHSGWFADQTQISRFVLRRFAPRNDAREKKLARAALWGTGKPRALWNRGGGGGLSSSADVNAVDV